MASYANNVVPVTSNPPAGVPWEQTTEYLALTNRVIPPGGPSSYSVPHPVGASPTDITSFVYGQASITLNTWPELMYMLSPTAEWKAARVNPKPLQKLDNNGQAMWERFPAVGEAARPILDYRGLPDTISTHEDWWWYDLWRRLHPQMEWKDIVMRMEVPNRDKTWDIGFQNAFQTSLRRKFHRHYNMVATTWFGTGKGAAESLAPVLAALQAANIPEYLNTTRGVTPGAVNPHQPNSQMIPHPVLTPWRYKRRCRNKALPPNDGSASDDDDSSSSENPDHQTSEDSGASKLRSGRRLNSSSTKSFTLMDEPSVARRRYTVPRRSPHKPPHKKVATGQIRKVDLPMTSQPRPDAILKVFAVRAGMTEEKFDDLLAEILAPAEPDQSTSKEKLRIRSQHPVSTPAAGAVISDDQVGNFPLHSTIPAPIEPSSRPLGPPATSNRRPRHHFRASDGYISSLPDQAERTIPPHSSRIRNVSELHRAPMAPTQAPEACTFGTPSASFQPYESRSQHPLSQVPSSLPMPTLRQANNGYYYGYTRTQHVLDTSYVRANQPVSGSFNSASERPYPGYEPCDSYPASDRISSEYEGW